MHSVYLYTHSGAQIGYEDMDFNTYQIPCVNTPTKDLQINLFLIIIIPLSKTQIYPHTFSNLL